MARPKSSRRRGERTLVERAPIFALPDDLDPTWNPQFPELTYAANSISLILPFAEPFFVRTSRAALEHLEGPVRERTRAFASQELEHHQHHRRFNRMVTARHPRLRHVEQWMRTTYAWFSRRASLKWNLAVVAGSEVVAYGIARWAEKHLARMFDGAEPNIASMFVWHLAEEVEHKSAAFDAWDEIDGSRWRFAAATLASLALIVWFTTVSSIIMMVDDRRWYHPMSWFRFIRWSVSLGFELLPTVAASLLPGHHPDDFTDPVFLPRWLSQWDPTTRTLPPWGT